MTGFRTIQQKVAGERASFHLICPVKAVGYLIAQGGEGGELQNISNSLAPSYYI